MTPTREELIKAGNDLKDVNGNLGLRIWWDDHEETIRALIDSAINQEVSK